MTTIDKCCEIAKELNETLYQIKMEKGGKYQLIENKNKGISQGEKKKILKLFNY